uniref:Solute carrier family 35 member B1 n=1 Tax=Phallusia mammillata TaxID=59560 RepID=A0A6F9DT94_9ASCI|nr:solute carrier family 35 member B1 [Phallusia mammillata]
MTSDSDEPSKVKLKQQQYESSTDEYEVLDMLQLSGKASVQKVESTSHQGLLKDISKLLGCSSVPREGHFKHLITYASGIFLFYLLYGIIQEKLLRGDYAGDHFTFSQALVFVQCVVNAMFSKAIMSYTKPEPDKTPKTLYALCALCYMGAMVASNHALIYVSYPKQVIGKACKPIPVMILGVIFAHKRYPVVKYLFVLMIVTGVAGFIYKDSKAVDSGDHLFSIGFGEMLLLLSLSLDGFTGVTQERMRAVHSTNHHHMMYNINLWSCFALGIGLVTSGQGIAFLRFVIAHPHVLWYLSLFSLTSAFGQHYIFLTVVTFGPLTCSVITTTRKFFTVLFSVIIFQNPMTSRQWLSTFLVFAGLGLDSIYGRSLKPKEKKQTQSK